MSLLMCLSTRVYSGVLKLYPPDLRRDFGPEISDLFSEDLADAWRGSGLAGVIGVWWCAACEVIRIAVPGNRTNPALIVPAVASAFNALSISAILIAAASHHPLAPNGNMAGDVLEYVVCPVLTTAFTALMVVHTGKISVLSLELDSADDRTSCSKSAI